MTSDAFIRSQSVPTINCRGRLLDLSTPAVMGIINVTPDSFFAASRKQHPDTVLEQANLMLNDGATILDLGGVSTRPGAADVSEHEEMDRLIPAVEAIVRTFPETIISIDTWRSAVAREAIRQGAHLINDVSGGQFDANMFETVAELQAPYVLMHTRGTPRDMQANPEYQDVVTEILDYFIERSQTLRVLGVKDIVLDPGFGFGKTIEHNYQLLKDLSVFSTVTGLPVLAGVSRKSMIYKYLNTTPEQTLSATSALHMAALERGAHILRVHDVREATEVVKLFLKLN